MSPLEVLRAAAAGLAHHPHDHGWRDLYGLFDYGLTHSGTELKHALIESYEQRPVGAAHLLTLLGIALKVEAEDKFSDLAGKGPLEGRLVVLEDVLIMRRDTISHVLLSRQNSFTCARRFLVPGVILRAYFSQYPHQPINFADLGTGLGILPRQLNSEREYDAFCDELLWPNGVPQFRQLPLASAFGVDRGPMPTTKWVHACYGPSEYYAVLYDELQASLNDPEVKSASVQYRELDLLDSAALASFIRDNKINAANLSYVLYELEPLQRQKTLEVIMRELHTPGLIIVTEPRDELHREGCVVEVFCNDQTDPLTLCFVSDGHFTGYVLPLDDYDEFVGSIPSPTGNKREIWICGQPCGSMSNHHLPGSMCHAGSAC